MNPSVFFTGAALWSTLLLDEERGKILERSHNHLLKFLPAPNIRAFPMLHFSFPFSFPFLRATAAADSAQLASTHPSAQIIAFALESLFSLLHLFACLFELRICEVFRCAFYTTLADYCKTHWKWSQPQCKFRLKADRIRSTGENINLFQI